MPGRARRGGPRGRCRYPLRVGSLAGSGTISADGAAAYNDTANDGGGGGGAGGSSSTATPDSVPGVTAGAQCADLVITKTEPAAVGAGGTVSYTLDVSNAGPATATDISVTDTLPDDVTFQAASGSGWTCTHSGNT